MATKIGGVPWWEQGDPGLPGRFLCVPDAIRPARDRAYPFVNAPEPINLVERDPLLESISDSEDWSAEQSFEEFVARAEKLYPLYVGEMDFMNGNGRLYLQFDGKIIHWEIQSS